MAEIKVRNFKAKTYALAEVEKVQLIPSSQPGGECPELPSRISGLGGRELGDLHEKMVAWLGFAYGQLALADIDYTCAERVKEFMMNKAMLSPAARETYENKATLLRGFAKISTQVQEITFEAELSYSKLALLKSKVQELEAYKEACSREITRRDQELRKKMIGA